MVGATEYRVVAEATATTDLASSYTDCHAHAAET
jgi:zinc transporter 1/2/3